MATVAETKSPSSLESLQRKQWNVVVGLWWTALLLALLAGWVFTKHAETAAAVGWVVLVLAAGTLAAALWQTFLMRALGRQPEEKQEGELLQRRPQVGLLALGLSALLIVLMVWLYAQEGIEAFPEAVSGGVLAVIGIITGLGLVSGPGKLFNQQRTLEGLVTRRKQFQITCLAVGSVLFVVGIWIFSQNPWWTVFPQAAGAMLLGLIFLGVGLWLMMSSAKEITATQMRMLILIAGGTAGLVVAVMTAIRALLWWDQLFAGGMSGWKGANAWQLWLCIYLELLGLALMFGSLYLAQADIRFNPVLRRLLYGYNAVFTGLLVLAVLVVLNIVVYATFPYTFNWSQGQGFYALSDRSKGILQSLKKSTKVIVLLPQGSSDFMDVKNLLENAQAYSPLLQVEYVSPDQDKERYRELSNRFPKLKESKQSFQSGAGRGLLIVYGPETETLPPHEFIPASELSEQRPMMPKGEEQPTARHEFKGEDLLMTRLSFLASDQRKPIIYFTQSNQEIDIKNTAPRVMEAGGFLAERLENANYQVRQLFWDIPAKEFGKEGVAFSKKNPGDPHKVPDDAKAVVIAWPKTPFSKDVIEALGEYMKKGGKLVILSIIADPKNRHIKTNLEDLVKQYGVDMGQDYVMHWAEDHKLRGLPPNFSFASTPKDSENPIAKGFARFDFLLDTARSVKPLGGKAGYQADVILEVDPRQGEFVWIETDTSTLLNPRAQLAQLIKTNKIFEKRTTKPVPVGVAVSDSKQTPRLVVLGMGREASNDPPIGGPPYHDFITGSLEWLGDRPQNIGIPPKKSNYYTLPTTADRRRMILLPFGLMALGLVGIGMGVWVVRRT